MAGPLMSPLVAAQLVVMHMGALHPYEKVLTVILAFGPFLLLGAAIVHRRRQDAAEDAEEGTTTVARAVGDPQRDK